MCLVTILSSGQTDEMNGSVFDSPAKFGGVLFQPKMVDSTTLISNKKLYWSCKTSNNEGSWMHWTDFDKVEECTCTEFPREIDSLNIELASLKRMSDKVFSYTEYNEKGEENRAVHYSWNRDQIVNSETVYSIDIFDDGYVLTILLECELKEIEKTHKNE